MYASVRLIEAFGPSKRYEIAGMYDGLTSLPVQLCYNMSLGLQILYGVVLGKASKTTPMHVEHISIIRQLDFHFLATISVCSCSRLPLAHCPIRSHLDSTDVATTNVRLCKAGIESGLGSDFVPGHLMTKRVSNEALSKQRRDAHSWRS
jgi:hypothetical protein